MQDRLKYRIYDTVDCEYVEVDAIRLTPNGVAVWLEETEPAINLKRYIIELCTGLKDKNGKLIYEGDIVKRGNTIAKVFWDDKCYAIKTKDCRICWLWENLSEVIGNIHENHELLGTQFEEVFI